jgi:hypothetical protein
MATMDEAVDGRQASSEARAERLAMFTAQGLITAHVGRDKRIANERQFAEAIAAALLAARSEACHDDKAGER